MRRAVATIPGRERQLRAADQPPHRPHDLGQQDQPGGQGLRAGPYGAARPRQGPSACCAEVPGDRGPLEPGAGERAAAPRGLRPPGAWPATASPRPTWRSAVEALFQGTVAGELVEGGLTSRVVVRFPERLRRHRDDLDALPVTTPAGRDPARRGGPRPLRPRARSRPPRERAAPRDGDRERRRGSDLAGVGRGGAERSLEGLSLPGRLPRGLRRAVRGGGARACGTSGCPPLSPPRGHVRSPVRRLPDHRHTRSCW